MILIDPKMVELVAVQAHAAPDAPGRHRHEEGRVDPGLGLRKMDERYELLRRAERAEHPAPTTSWAPRRSTTGLQPEDDEERKRIPTYMPYIVIVADEMADMMMTAGKGGRAAHHPPGAEARAVGIHLILATQKPTVDVITGLIKWNLPARIAFQVTSRSDSPGRARRNGGRQLLGNGDMLFLIPGHVSTSSAPRGRMSRDDEVNRHLPVPGAIPRRIQPRAAADCRSAAGRPARIAARALEDRDELYEPAIEIVVREGRGSVLAAAAGAGHRLRPGRPADRLHGRGRHRRRIQERLRPRGALHLGGMGSAQERRREDAGRRGVNIVA